MLTMTSDGRCEIENMQNTTNAKIKVAVSVDKQRTLIRIYMEKYISV